MEAKPGPGVAIFERLPLHGEFPHLLRLMEKNQFDAI